MQFSDTTGNTGILQRVRKMARVDSTQLPTVNVVNSANDRLDMIMSYGLGADGLFQLDDSNHTKLPIGTTNLVADQSDYSFLTDEQGNRILNIYRVDALDSSGIYRELKSIDETQIVGALDEFRKTSGLPQYYDKIADNIVRLYPAPISSVSSGLKFYFHRAPSYFTATDTTKQPGFANVLHRGFVIQGAYDAALTLGLENLSYLAVELEKENQVMEDYFAQRNPDTNKRITPVLTSAR
jgi:hypothetical protein